jgi:hypothetical protein
MILFIWFYHVRENYRQTDSMSSAINEPLDYAGSFLLFSKWESYYTTRLAAHVWNLYNIKRFPFSLGQHEERDVADACIITIKRGRGFLILFFLRHWVCNGAPRVGVFLLAPFFSLNSNFVNKTRIKIKENKQGMDWGLCLDSTGSFYLLLSGGSCFSKLNFSFGWLFLWRLINISIIWCQCGDKRIRISRGLSLELLLLFD